LDSELRFAQAVFEVALEVGVQLKSVDQDFVFVSSFGVFDEILEVWEHGIKISFTFSWVGTRGKSNFMKNGVDEIIIQLLG